MNHPTALLLRRAAAGAVLGLALVASAQAASTLVYCSEGSPEGFDPSRYTAGTTLNASAQPLFNRLVEFEIGGTRIVPALAERWDVSSDGLVYTFHLRPGVKFHTTPWFVPTRDFDADDVLFTFRRMLDADFAFNKATVPPPSFEFADDLGLRTNIAKLDKLDPLTVRFTLKTVDAAFLADVAMEFASIHSAEYAEQLMKAHAAFELNTRPVGTGPFVFKRYDKDAQIRYTANPTFWRGRPQLDHLVYAITPDSAVRAQKLRADECQISEQPKPAEVRAFQRDPHIRLLSEPGMNVGYLTLNVTHKPLDNLDVRRAINMAIDKKALVQAVYQGEGQVALNALPPTLWSYDTTLKDYPYDPAQAKALLAKAGYPHGFDTTLWALPVQRPYNPNGTQTAEMVQADLAKVGIRARIVKYEWAEYLKRAEAGESDIGMLGWSGDNGDPDNFLGAMLSCAAVGGSNYAEWCDKEYDDLVTRAKQTNDLAERTRLYQKAQQVFKREAVWVPLAHSVVYQPLRKNVVGYKMSPFLAVQFYGVSLQ